MVTLDRLIDRYNRHLNYLRISVTDRCNLKCIYCTPRDRIIKLSHEEILRYEEILRIVHIGISLGISKVRVTGGEPLVRSGIYDFLKTLCAIDGLQDISLTTNGVLLKNNIDKIKAAGIHRINISLDTLNAKRFQEITGYDGFQKVTDGIMAAIESGFDPVKLNVVALRNINEDELTELASLSFSMPVHVRFIEQMPIGNLAIPAKPLLAPEIKRKIETLGKLIPVENSINDGPAIRYRLEGAKGEVGFIRPLSCHFCNRCNRLRLTASGKLRACLLSDYEIDIKKPLRTGCSDDHIKEIFFRAVDNKPFEHHISYDNTGGVSGQMCAIGG